MREMSMNKVIHHAVRRDLDRFVGALSSFPDAPGEARRSRDGRHGQEVGRDRSPKQAGAFFAWLLDGASEAERTAIGEPIPGPVLAILTGLFGRRHRKDVATVWSS